MKRKFQLFALTKGEQRVILLIVIGLLLGAAWRIQEKPKMRSALPAANAPASAAEAIDEEETHEQE